MPVHLSIVRRDPSVPVEQVHVMLYSYFPWARMGEPRPFVWRLLDAGTIAVLSARPSTAPGCRPVALSAGMTLDFALAYKRVRNTSGARWRTAQGERRRGHDAIEITDPAEMRERLIRYARERGMAIGYARIVRTDRLRLVKDGRPLLIPVAHAAGKALVTDAARAEALLASGGPGTGRAYGLGMWWLPELMAPAAVEAAA